MNSPGPELKVAVQCTTKRGDVQSSTTKVFNITVVDRNDNSIKVQDEVTNLTLSSPYFLEVGGTLFLCKCVRTYLRKPKLMNFECRLPTMRINVLGSLPLGLRLYK